MAMEEKDDGRELRSSSCCGCVGDEGGVGDD